MIGSQKKSSSEVKRSQKVSESKTSVVTAGSGNSSVQEQDERNEQIAGTMIRMVMQDLKDSQADKALIKIFKSIRHWPSQIERSDTHTFTPQFRATEISATETEENDSTVTCVSFCHSGEKFEFVATISNSSSTESSTGYITLHENGEQVIGMRIQQAQNPDDFIFREVDLVQFGSWMNRIVSIEAELTQYAEHQANQ